MSDRSKIEWTDASWNPIRAELTTVARPGWYCEHVSEGCRFCYAEGINNRLGTGLPFKPGHRQSVNIYLDEKVLLQPLKWKRPRMVFVCSMSDLFGSWVLDGWLDRIFAVMALCPQHTFQCLTKRPERMREYIGSPSAIELSERIIKVADAASDWSDLYPKDLRWPLPNVWLGTSCEDQETANARIPLLLDTPAAVRFVSAEPLLGPISYIQAQMLDWIIVGGESGPKARPMHPDWARGIRDQCILGGAKFFMKQWGGWELTQVVPGGDLGSDMRADRVRFVQRDREPDGHFRKGDVTMRRVGKKEAGRLLDGREWNEFPEGARA